MSRVGLGLTSAVLVLALSGCAGLAAGAGPESPPQQAKQSRVAKAEPPTPTDPPVQLDDLLGALLESGPSTSMAAKRPRQGVRH